LVSALDTGAKQVTKEATVEMSGVVIATNRGSATIELANGSVIRGIISGRLLNHRIKVMTGDRVQVEMTPYDLTKGAIWTFKNPRTQV
jgi:translation initiation factor IF-1